MDQSAVGNQNMAKTTTNRIIMCIFLLKVISCELHLKSEEIRDSKDTVDGPCFIGRTGGLARLDGVKTGHVQEKDLGDKKVKIITRAMKPPLFEIPNFLSREECDHLVHFAEQNKMFNSQARGGLTQLREIEIPVLERGKSLGNGGLFCNWDFNHDGIITPHEAVLFAEKEHYLRFTEQEILEMFQRINLTEMDDGKITQKEFETANTNGMEGIIFITGRTHPKHRHRYSSQTWINQRKNKHEPLLSALQERILKLTGLSKEIVYGSERLQVVRYTEYGHYHAHYDSETHTRTDAPCCHQISNTEDVFKLKNPCRLCRYVTILYYLNDVEKGGETAFPVADNTTLNRTFMEMTRGKHDYYNLNENCLTSNLVVKPKQGMAIMWYNHYKDEDNQWMGEMDDYSLHGGCGVRKGIKWIANNWITAPYKNTAHIKSTDLV